MAKDAKATDKPKQASKAQQKATTIAKAGAHGMAALAKANW